jgi:hypothetical protein
MDRACEEPAVVDDLGAMKERKSSHQRSEREGRRPAGQPWSTGSADGFTDRRAADDQPAWRVLLGYARPYRLALIGGGLLSLATGGVGWSCR